MSIIDTRISDNWYTSVIGTLHYLLSSLYITHYDRFMLAVSTLSQTCLQHFIPNPCDPNRMQQGVIEATPPTPSTPLLVVNKMNKSYSFAQTCSLTHTHTHTCTHTHTLTVVYYSNLQWRVMYQTTFLLKLGRSTAS